jgi:hypothetical protein
MIYISTYNFVKKRSWKNFESRQHKEGKNHNVLRYAMKENNRIVHFCQSEICIRNIFNFRFCFSIKLKKITIQDNE